MRPGAGDILDRYVVAARLEGHTVVVVAHVNRGDGDIRAGTDIEAVRIFRGIGGVGGCVHAQVREDDVLRVAFDRVEHVRRVLLAEAGHFDVATSGDIQEGGTFIAAVGGKNIPSRLIN